MKRLLCIGLLVIMPSVAFAWDEDESRRDQRENPREVTVTPGGAVDSRGNFYPSDGQGLVNPRTGEYYPESGTHGYINPRTGQFIDNGR